MNPSDDQPKAATPIAQTTAGEWSRSVDFDALIASIAPLSRRQATPAVTLAGDLGKGFETLARPRRPLGDLGKGFETLARPRRPLGDLGKGYETLTRPNRFVGLGPDLERQFRWLTEPHQYFAASLQQAALRPALARPLWQTAALRSRVGGLAEAIARGALVRSYVAASRAERAASTTAAHYAEPLASAAIRAYEDEPERLAASVDPTLLVLVAQMAADLAVLRHEVRADLATLRQEVRVMPPQPSDAAVRRGQMLAVLAWLIGFVGFDHTLAALEAVVDAVR